MTRPYGLRSNEPSELMDIRSAIQALVTQLSDFHEEHRKSICDQNAGFQALFDQHELKIGQKIESSLDLKIKPLLETISSLTIKVDAQRTVIDSLADENDVLRTRVDALHGRLEYLEIQERRDEVVIQGLRPHSYSEAATSSVGLVQGGDTRQSTVANVLNFCQNTLKVNIGPDSIVKAVQLPKPLGSKVLHCPILVKFADRQKRDLVLQMKSKLRELPDKIFINENLIPKNAMILHECRKLMRSKKVARVWTRGGQVFLKVDDKSSSAPQKILTLEDLGSLKLANGASFPPSD